MSAPDGLRGNADFRRLWAAQAISAFGSRITRTALPIIAVKTLGESESIVGLLTAMQLAPGVVLAMFAGGFVDRGRKRRILVAADLIRAALILSLTAAWALGALGMTQVVLVGAGVGAASALFHITDVAFLPALIGRKHLAAGNARLEATEAIAEITGPASTGALIAAFGAPLAVALDALTYLWSAAMLGRIRAPEAHARRPHAGDGVPRAAGLDTGPVVKDEPLRRGEDFRIGLRTVFGHPLVRPVVLSFMVWSISGGFFMATYTLYCLRTLQLSESTFGVIIAMGGVGSLAGALLSRAFVRTLGLGRALLVTSILSTSCALFIPLASGPVVLGIAFLLAHQLLSDGFSVAFVIQAVTLRQTVLPRDVLGRANAAILVCTEGVLPVAALIAGFIAQVAGIHVAVWIGVLVGLLAPALLWPLRHLQTMPEPAASGPIPAPQVGESPPQVTP